MSNSQRLHSTRPPSTVLCNSEACLASWVQTLKCTLVRLLVVVACCRSCVLVDALGMVASADKCPSLCATQRGRLPTAMGGYIHRAHQLFKVSICCVVGTRTIARTESRPTIDAPHLAGQCNGQTSLFVSIAYPSINSSQRRAAAKQVRADAQHRRGPSGSKCVGDDDQRRAIALPVSVSGRC